MGEGGVGFEPVVESQSGAAGFRGEVECFEDQIAVWSDVGEAEVEPLGDGLGIGFGGSGELLGERESDLSRVWGLWIRIG